jgi:hypothetical protein
VKAWTGFKQFRTGSFGNNNEASGSIKTGNFLTSYQILKENPTHGVIPLRTVIFLFAQGDRQNRKQDKIIRV